MNSKPRFQPVLVNPVTQAAHRRQVRLQIWLPLGITLLVIAAVCVLIVLTAASGGRDAQIGQWRDTTLVLLFIPAILQSLITLAILGGSVYLMGMLLRKLPFYTYLAQFYVNLAAEKIHQAADLIVQPALKVQGAWAGWQALLSRLRRGSA